MDDIHKLRQFYKLKSVYRANSVEGRKESSAEHTWSCLILADYFLSAFPHSVDRLKVYELLLYHDVVEIEAGDSPLIADKNEAMKKELEMKSAQILSKTFPNPLNKKFLTLFTEYEDQKSIESRFAKAIDALDAEIHELDYKKDWKGWSSEFLVKKKAHLFREFPELKIAFDDILAYLIENKYFD